MGKRTRDNGAGLPPTNRTANLSLSIDWQEYYNRFKQEHGDPVNYKGRLLFADGWTYHPTDVKGPEWAPPDKEEELHKLKIAYWQERKSVLETERAYLKEVIRSIEELSHSKSMPLVSRRRLNKDTNKYEHTLITSQPLKLRLAWIEDDLIHCNETLARLMPVDAEPIGRVRGDADERAV